MFSRAPKRIPPKNMASCSGNIVDILDKSPSLISDIFRRNPQLLSEILSTLLVEAEK